MNAPVKYVFNHGKLPIAIKRRKMEEGNVMPVSLAT